MSPYLRTVKTSSGATAVQIVHSSHRGSRDIEHLGPAYTAAAVELLETAGRQKLAAGQGELDLGLQAGAPGGPLPIIASRMGCLLDALSHAFDVLGFWSATGGDGVFRDLVVARIIEPVSKLDSLRVLEEAGLAPPPYRTVTRRLRVFARESWRQQISAACAAHAGPGPASLVLYDVSALYFVAGAGMVSEANQKAIEAAGLSFILGARIPDIPYVVAKWRRARECQKDCAGGDRRESFRRSHGVTWSRGRSR